MNRNLLIIGSILLAPLIIVVMLASVFLLSNRKGERLLPIRQPFPASGLTYCSAVTVKPCIVSFGLDSDGRMLVNVLLPNASFPEFYLKIIRNAEENEYECRMDGQFPNSAYCIGAKMPPGEVLQFMIISKNGDALLAQGNFALIGLGFPTPGIVMQTITETPIRTAVSPTQGVLSQTHKPTATLKPGSTPKPPSSTPGSYPNPKTYP